MKRSSRNKRINLFQYSSISGLEADRSLEMSKADFLVFLKFTTSAFFNSEGQEMMSDGYFWTEFKIEVGNYIELVDTDTKKYRIEAVEEILNSSGSLHGYKATFVRDSSFE